MLARQTLSYPSPSSDGQRISLEAEAPRAPSLPRTSIAIFVAIVQAILLPGHFLVYETLHYFWPPSTPAAATALQVGFALLSISFVLASILAFRYYNLVVRLFYTVASIWLGLFNFLFLAALLCWFLYAAFTISHVDVSRPALLSVLFGCALLVGLYG